MKHTLISRISFALRRYLFAGLATVFPVAATFWVLYIIFRKLDGLLGKHLPVHIPGLGLLCTIGILLLIGFLSTHFLGRFVLPWLEASLNRLPIVRQIYPAIKQLSQFLFGGEDTQKASIKQAVLVEYPRMGTYSLAFVTHEEKTDVTGTTEKLLTLLIPTPPSPLTGPVIFVPEDEVIPLSMSIEEALKLIVSGGVVSAPLQAAPYRPSHRY